MTSITRSATWVLQGWRGGTISHIGVYGGMADPLSLLTDDDPLGVDTFATHTLPLDDAPHAYDIFQKKEDGAVKIIPKP